MISHQADCHRMSFVRSLSSIHLRQEGAASSSSSLASKLDSDANRKRERRAVSPSQLPVPPFCTDSQHSRESSQERSVKKLPRREMRRASRRGYQLGETARCQSHMAIKSSPDQATRAVDLLHTHDYAFVKRSDGSYSYAIVAFRSYDPSKGDSLTFVVKEDGSTKTIRRKHWSSMVRVVSTEGSDAKVASTTQMETEDINDGAPVNAVSFIPQLDNDEWSLISF